MEGMDRLFSVNFNRSFNHNKQQFLFSYSKPDRISLFCGLRVIYWQLSCSDNQRILFWDKHFSLDKKQEKVREESYHEPAKQMHGVAV